MKKSFKQIGLLFLALALFVSVISLWGTVSVGTTEFPGGMTQEEAKAYHEKLKDFMDYSSLKKATIETIGEEKTPILRIITNSADELWLYKDKKIHRISTSDDWYNADVELNSFTVCIDGVNYYGVSKSYDGAAGASSLNYNTQQTLTTLYTIKSGQLEETSQFLYYYDDGIPESSQSAYISGQWIDSFFSHVEGTPAPPEFLDDLSVYQCDFTDERTDTYGTGATENYYSYSYSCFSSENGKKEAISNAKYLELNARFFGEDGENKINIAQNEYDFDELDRSFNEAQQLLVELSKAIIPEYTFPEVLASLNQDEKREIENLLFPIWGEDFNAASSSEQALFNYLGWYIECDLCPCIPSQTETYVEDSSPYHDGRAWNIHAYSVQDICSAMQQLFGRNIDFTKYQKDHKLSTDELKGLLINNSTANTLVYLYGNTVYLCYVGDLSGEAYFYNLDIEQSYDMGQDYFLVLSKSTWGADWGNTFRGYEVSLLKKTDAKFQILRQYPINNFPSEDELRKYFVKDNPISNVTLDYGK